MFIDFLLNIALIISGIYLFYRIQFFEEKKIVETGLFQSLLMTTLSILSLLVPFNTSQGEFSLFFIPLLILAAYNKFYYGLMSAAVVYFFYHFIFEHSTSAYIVFLALYMLFLMVVPFMRKITNVNLVVTNIIFTSLYMTV